MKKKLLGVLGIFGAVIALASCSDSATTNYSSDEEETTSIFKTAETKSSNSSKSVNKTVLNYEPEYVYYDVLANTTNDTTKNGIEDTVENVYGSVVSILAYNETSVAAGSGVLYTYSEGYDMSFIVTCFHVIEDYSYFEVTYNNNTMDESDDITYEAKLVGGYEDSDLAVLSIEASDLVYADIFEYSDNLKLGSSVICIGNPLGTLPGSVSSGIVSYVNRSVSVDDYTKMNLIQTDVAINSGNSGGGLFNTAGALIGIVNAKYSSTGIEGLGFAIPSTEVISVINEITSNAKYDIANKIWSYGYVEGDYEFGFTISYYQQQFSNQGLIYISSVEDNDTYSGTNLVTNYAISSVYIDYKDENKEDINYQISTYPSSSEATYITQMLYDANLELGDVITISYKNGNNVSFEIEQFIYSI